jgi:hypothetical protein
MSGEFASADLTFPPDDSALRQPASVFDRSPNVTYKRFSMTAYKRNQVEEAISRTIGERSEKPSSDLRIRLKRLLEADRGLGRDPRSSDPEAESFAFYSEDAPGRGVEVRFSEYEAFALLIGLQLLQHGWPQGFVVRVMRLVRSQLEAQHMRILLQDPKELFDEKFIRQKARPGDLYFDNTDPVLLTIVSGRQDPKDGGEEPPRCSVCRSMQEVSRFVKEQAARSWTLFEVVSPAHALAIRLSRAEPRSRGRSS